MSTASGSERGSRNGLARYRSRYSFGAPPSPRSGLIVENGALELKLISGVRALDLGDRYVQLRLAQLDDRTQSHVVALLRQVQRLLRLAEQLGGKADPFVGRV